MTLRELLASLVGAMWLVGCGSSSSTPPSTPASIPDITGNWQIQQAAPPGSSGAPTAGTVLALGALKSSGANVNGTFRYSDLTRPLQCSLDEVAMMSGTMSSMNHLALQSSPLANGGVITVDLDASSGTAHTWTGTIAVSGSSCAVAAEGASAVEVQPLTGTYTGNLSTGPLEAGTGQVAGSGTLTLTQSSTPAADGQFPVQGTLTYALGSCNGSIAVNGDVSGVG